MPGVSESQSLNTRMSDRGHEEMKADSRLTQFAHSTAKAAPACSSSELSSLMKGLADRRADLDGQKRLFDSLNDANREVELTYETQAAVMADVVQRVDQLLAYFSAQEVKQRQTESRLHALESEHERLRGIVGELKGIPVQGRMHNNPPVPSTNANRPSHNQYRY